MIRSGFILILLIGLALLSNREGVMLLLYQMNQKYITEKYCENKEQPEMHCEGKCFLGKQIKAEQENSDNIPQKKENCQKPIYISEEVLTLNKCGTGNNILTIWNEQMEINLFTDDIFHPPV